MHRWAHALALVLASMLACAAPLASRADSTATKVVNYTPARMNVVATARGSCWEGSIAVNRADAYRCFIGNEIHDPCFTRGSGSVACPDIPDNDRGPLILLTKPLPQNTTTGATTAWAMRLQSGARCRAGTGTVIPGYPFYCSSVGVCASPLRPAGSAVYYTECGAPQSTSSGPKVVSSKRYAVSILWR